MNIRSLRLRPYGIFIYACAALALAATSPSFALSPLGPDVTVRYQDLDLNTASGASKLLKRIRHAAAKVCEPINQDTYVTKKKRDECVSQLTAETVAKVNRPMLLAAHESSLKKGKSKVVLPG